MIICLERGATCILPSWCHCHLLSLVSVKSRLVYLSGYRLTKVVPNKGPLNVRLCVCVFTVTNCFLILHRFLCHLCLHILVCGNICFDVQMGSCWNCKSVVPQNLAKCLTCDVLLTTDRGVLQPKQHEDPACLVCVVCRTPNSRNDRARSCITCSASLSNATVVMLIYS